MLKKKKSQSVLEYAVIVSVVIAGLLAMQTYVKRGYQGKLRDSADNIGDQYSPGHTTSHYTIHQESETSESFENGTSTTNITRQKQSKTGSETVTALDEEDWPTR